MNLRESVLLANTYSPLKHDKLIYNQNMAGWYWSIKLDGLRAFWDGAISYGIPASDVPYANCDKHHTRRNIVMATGLWTRLLQPIAAPYWFLESLPINIPLDGELYAGIGKFEEVMSTCRKYEPINDEWKRIKFCVFDSFTLPNFLKEGKINNPNLKKEIGPEALEWAIERMKEQLPARRPYVYRFGEVYDYLKEEFVDHPNIKVVEQTIIRPEMKIEEKLAEVSQAGAEGLMLRNANSMWEAKRSNDLLKVKMKETGVGKVIGFKFGEGKLLGMIGALRIEWNGRVFDLSGLTDEERQLSDRQAAINNPGKYAPDNVEAIRFKRGQQVKFVYNGLSADLRMPKFARYLR